MIKNNPHTGSNFDDFLKEQGMYEEVTEKAQKRAISDPVGWDENYVQNRLIISNRSITIAA